MSFDGFIRLDGLEGESTDEKHAGWIEILSFDCRIEQNISTTASSVGGALPNGPIFYHSVLPN